MDLERFARQVRQSAQADALEENGIGVDLALCIDVPDEVIEKRMSGRRTCSVCSATYHVESNPPKVEGICDACGGALTIRKDDMPETVKNRLKVYHDQTEPLLSYYAQRGKLVTVEGEPTIEATSRKVFDALGID